MKPTNWPNIINWVAAAFVFLLAAGGFIISYANLWDMGLSLGIPPRLAWIWPLLVDFGLIVFSLAVVRASLNGKWTAKPWALVALYTVATVVFNVKHAPADYWSWAAAVVAPVTLFLAFETLMGMLRDGIKDSGRPHLKAQTIETEATPARQVAQAEAQPVAPVKRLAEPESPPDPGIQERRERVLALRQDGLNNNQIAEALGVGLSTVKRDLKGLNGRVKG